jgi:hypothetical protein
MSEHPTPERSSPAERAAEVERRVKELQQRRAQLAAGEPPSLDSVNVARDRAADSMRRAREAHHAAALRHEELARVHEQTANTYQRAALEGVGPSDHLQQAADHHWQAAHDSHLDAVEDEAQCQDPSKSSSG